MTDTLPPSIQRPTTGTMRAIRLMGSVVQLDPAAEVPALGRDSDVLVRLSVAGLCRTDLYVADGQLAAKAGVVLGHEAAGLVVEAGPGADVDAGALVSFDPRIQCGSCGTCRAQDGRNRKCLTPRRLGVERNGVFAEYVVVPRAALVEIDPSVPHLRAAYFEPVAAALGALAAPGGSDLGVIVGQGRIAELTARLMEWSGRPRPRLMNLAELRAAEERFDFVIDAGLGDDGALSSMTNALYPGGTLVLKSRAVAPQPFTPAEWVNRDLQVLARSYGDFGIAARALADPGLQLEDLFGPVHGLDAFETAFQEARASEGVKQFLDLGAGG